MECAILEAIADVGIRHRDPGPGSAIAVCSNGKHHVAGESIEEQHHVGTDRRIRMPSGQNAMAVRRCTIWKAGSRAITEP